MNFKVFLISALMILGLGMSVKSQDFTLSPVTGIAGDVSYAGSFVMRGDSSVFALDGKVGTGAIKDFATATIGLFNTANVYSDTCVLITYGSWPTFLRLKSTDSVGAKNSNYVDISAINDRIGTVTSDTLNVPLHFTEPIIFWAKRTALTANTWTVDVAITRARVDYIPEKFRNEK